MELEILYVDEKTKEIAQLSGKDLTDQLDKLKRAIEYMRARARCHQDFYVPYFYTLK